MKTRVLALLLAGFSTFAQTSERNDPRFVLKISPQHLREHSIKGGVEYFDLNRMESLQLLVTGTWLNEYPVDHNEERELKGLSAELQYRYYFLPFRTTYPEKREKNASGAYVGGFFQAGEHTDTFTSTYGFRPPGGETYLRDFFQRTTFRTSGYGLIAGFQKTFFRKLLTELYIGAGYQQARTSAKGERYVPENGTAASDMDPAPKSRGRYPSYDYEGLFPKAGIAIGVAF